MISASRILKILIAVLLVAPMAHAVTSAQLAKEQESLYNRLDRNDPLRSNLALRLADLLFDASTEVDKTSDFSAAEAKTMEGYRLKAISLYENSLTGFSGQFPKPDRSGELRIKFQLARLYMDQGITNKAESLWTELAAQKDEPRIQRESALRRAEKLELSMTISDLIKAENYYNVALPSCNTKDLCSYIYYRRSWIHHRLGESDKAVADLQKALEQADKSSIAEILKDLTLFLSHATWSAEKAVAYVEKLSTQYNSPDLLEKLTDAYFTADHRAEYNYAIEYLNKKSPRIDRMVASLEFQYSERNIAKMQDLMVALGQSSPNAFTNPSKKVEVEKILYRLVVQWDGEREKHPEYKQVFDQGVQLYTRLYPSTPNYDKVISGWLAAETSPDRKIGELQKWADQQAKLKNKTESLKLHQTRLAIAVKANNTPIIIEESTALAGQVGDSKEKRELYYQQAHALYEQKQYDRSLPIFVGLADTHGGKPDQTAIYSQNLALDILAQQKRYDDIMKQANSWTKNQGVEAAANHDPALAKEVGDMAVISEKALFEKSSQTPNAESLKNFIAFCMADKFMPKSCENAKTLAVQLKDEDALIAILKKQENKPELTTELEFGGHFVQAAALLEPGLAQPKAAFEDHLRVAMLYELGGDYKNRDRILRGVIADVQKKKMKLSANAEDLFYLTLKDAGMINVASINLPWNEQRKLRLAADLENAGHGTPQTRAIVSASCVDTGSRWQQIRLAELSALYTKQSKIQFIGRASQKHFNERIKALKGFADGTTCYLKGADTEHRYALINKVSLAYKEMADQIKSSPIPDGLDAETLAQVTAQINDAAKPFETQANDWGKQAANQLAKLDAAQKASVESQYANWNFEVPAPAKVAQENGQLQFNWGPLLEKMRKNPFDNQTLADLKQHFESHGQKRLAAYFEGRLSSGSKKE